MRLKYLIPLLVMLLLAGLISACSVDEGSAAEDIANRPVNVVATTGMIADIAAIVGGERAEVKGLMGPGVDPHLYKATESNVADLQNADIIFYNGLHLEAQMTGIFERMNDLGIHTVAVTDEIDRDVLLAPPEFVGNYDPHVWFDVTMWMSAVEVVRDTYMEIDPTHAETYAENAENLLAELDTLHAYVVEQAGRVPEEQRVLVTAHDAFNYFGQAYGFEVRGLQGISTESEAGTADVQMLTDFIVERQIPAIFVESSVPQRNIEAVQAAAEAKGFTVEIGGDQPEAEAVERGTHARRHLGSPRQRQPYVGAVAHPVRLQGREQRLSNVVSSGDVPERHGARRVDQPVEVIVETEDATVVNAQAFPDGVAALDRAVEHRDLRIVPWDEAVPDPHLDVGVARVGQLVGSVGSHDGVPRSARRAVA